MKRLCFLLSFCFIFGGVYGGAEADAACAFNFAQNYDTNDLITNQASQQKFMKDVMFWEGKFATDNIGLNYATAMTYDGKWMS